MRVKTTADSSRREIRFAIEQGDAPDLDVTESWQSKKRSIRPDHVTLVIVDGETRRITVSGPMIKLSGELSGSMRGKREYRATSNAYVQKERIENAPEWVRTIWAEAPAGMTGWDWTADELHRAHQAELLKKH